MKHKLDLLGNAIDSLNQGLRLYIEGVEGSDASYKFAVLHIAHYLELLFKHAVALEHRLLIYSKPDAKDLRSAHTIGMWEALQILRNVGHTFDEQLMKDLTWLKDLRNSIEHFQFEMEPAEVKTALGRLVKAAHDFADEAISIDLAPKVSEKYRETYRELYDDYLAGLRAAKAEAQAALGADEEITDCYWCGEDEVAVESATDVHCYACGVADPKRPCSICGDSFRESALTVWNDDDPEKRDFACFNCEDRIFHSE